MQRRPHICLEYLVMELVVMYKMLLLWMLSL